MEDIVYYSSIQLNPDAVRSLYRAFSANNAAARSPDNLLLCTDAAHKWMGAWIALEHSGFSFMASRCKKNMESFSQRYHDLVSSKNAHVE